MDKKKYVRVDPFTGFPEKDVKEDAPTTSTAGVAATGCLLYTSPSPRDLWISRMPSSA